MIGKRSGKRVIVEVLEEGSRGRVRVVCDCGWKSVVRMDRFLHTSSCPRCAAKLRRLVERGGRAR